jgi:alpha/beta superfamily hydrolase
MPSVIFPGPEGRLEGRYAPAPRPRAPGGDDPAPALAGRRDDERPHRAAALQDFVDRGFADAALQFPRRRPQPGQLRQRHRRAVDAAAALDWVQSIHPESQTTWVAGVSFGALIGMQLLMRRPEIRGFISIAPPANMYDFSFLAPCPASGIFIQGAADTVVQPIAVQKLVEKLRTQKHITIHHEEIPRANHFFENELEELMASVDNYLDFRLSPDCTIR